LIFVCAVLCVPQAPADTLTGEVRGSVLDLLGHVPLPGAAVTLVNADRGWKKQLQTNAGGDFLFVQLEPGNYSVVVELEGYYRAEKTDVLVPLNQPKVVVPPIELRRLVATPTQQITLRGEQTKTAIIDLTAPGPGQSVLAYLSEPGLVSMVSLLDWSLRSNYAALLLQNLPLKGGRSFDQLALLSPGVFRIPYSSGSGPAVGIGVGSAGQFVANGLRARSNNFTVDGSDNNDEDIGVRRQGFVALVPQTVESVQEFQVVTAGFPAESGRNVGAMVNAVSRSGQKAVHGSAYGLFSDDVLEARDFFEIGFRDSVNAGANSGGSFGGEESGSRQYGGVIGGPMVAEKLFYFLSAEQQRYRGTSLGHFVVPTPEERGLRIRDGFVPVAEVGKFFRDRLISYSNLAGIGVFSLYPLPNNPSGPFGAHNYSQAKERKGDGTVLSSKTDWYVTPAHSFFARYNYTGDRSVIPFTGEAINSSVATWTRTQNISMFLNSTIARRANALRFSFGRTRLAFPPGKSSPLLFGSSVSDPGAPSTGVIEVRYGRFGPFGATGPIGQLSVLPYSTIGVDVFNFPQGRADNTFQLSDFFAHSTTTHDLKVGFDMRRSQLNSFAGRNSRPLLQFGYGRVAAGCVANPTCIFATADGQLRGTDLAALGAPAAFLQALNTDAYGDTTIGLRFTQYDFFVQDNWKLRPGLTLNMGLRYEVQTTPAEVNGRIERTFGLTPDRFGHLQPSGGITDRNIIAGGNSSFDAALLSLQEFLAGRQKIYDADRRRIGPRFGLAWDPLGDGRTSVRAGYSLSYDANLGAVTSQSRNVFPTLVPINLDLNFAPPDGSVVNSPVFFSFIPTRTPLVRPGTLNIYNLTGDAFATGLGTLFLQAPPLPGADLSSNGLAFTLPEKALKPSSAQHVLLSIERQFGTDYLGSARYVRTKGAHLARFTTPNAGVFSTPILFSTADRPIALLDLPPALGASASGRPVRGLGAYTVIENSADSGYDAMQISVEKRSSRGIEFRAHWTWSHAIDQVSDPFDGRGFFSLPQDVSDPGLERASAGFDARHRLVSMACWDLPAFRITRGWRLAVTAEFQSGQPYTVNTALDRNGDGNLTDRPDTLLGIDVYPGSPDPLRLDSTLAPLQLLAPSPGQNGRVARNAFRAAGIATVDLAISRTLPLAGETRLDMRAEIFNLFNRTHFGIPIRILESPGFGRVFDTQVPAREVRLSAKFSF